MNNFMKKIVKIYTTPICPFCKRLKDLMKEANINFQEYDVANDDEAREYILSKSGRLTTPQIEMGDKIIYDYGTEEELIEDIKKWMRKKEER